MALPTSMYLRHRCKQLLPFYLSELSGLPHLTSTNKDALKQLRLAHRSSDSTCKVVDRASGSFLGQGMQRTMALSSGQQKAELALSEPM